MALNKYRGAALNPDARSQIARVRELLSPHVETAITNLVALAQDPTVRCATRERANSKILTMYVDCVSLEGAEVITEDSDDRVKVVVVSQQDLQSAQQVAGDRYLEQLRGKQ